MLFVKNHIPYLWDLSNSFSNSFVDFYCCEGFHQVIYQKEWSIKLRVDNGGWHETLNLVRVSRCEMLHFVTSYMKQNKSRKQTFERAQYRLEISFKSNAITVFPRKFKFLCLRIIVPNKALTLGYKRNWKYSLTSDWSTGGRWKWRQYIVDTEGSRCSLAVHNR